MQKIFNILFVLIGGFIGAGFASGKEILIFFNNYKFGGILGIIISSFIFSIIIYKIFLISFKYDINNYEDLLYELNFPLKNKIIKIFKLIVNAFLLSSFYIMVAAFSSFFYIQFNIPIWLTSIILCLFCFVIFNNNIENLIKISNILIPFLIILILFIGFEQINAKPLNIDFSIEKGWLISSLLYVSYNSILLIPLSLTLKKYLCNKKIIFLCSFLVGFVICILSFILYFLLLNYNSYGIDLPILDITKNTNNFYKKIYSIVIISAILTTLLSSGFTFIYNVSYSSFSKTKIVFLMCFSAIFISFFGFSNLINILYPFFGYIGFLQIILILIK